LNWRWEFGDWIWIGFCVVFSREDLINEIVVDHAREKTESGKTFFDMFCWSSQLSRIKRGDGDCLVVEYIYVYFHIMGLFHV
jgi:hypothetical protein